MYSPEEPEPILGTDETSSPVRIEIDRARALVFQALFPGELQQC